MLALPVAAGVAGSVLGASPAHAFSRSSKEELFNVPGSKTIRPFVFLKPDRFKQYSNPVDPSGYVFKNTNYSDVKFTISTNADPNSSAAFTPEFFVNDYNRKYSNATGSKWTLISGGDGPPAREDKALSLKYYQFEYEVTKQMDFGFDSIKTLHFFTTFVVAPESLYVLNCQVPAALWDQYKPIMTDLRNSFSVTG